MMVTLNLNPELEAGLFAQAQASRMTVEEYLLSVIESAVLPAGQHTLSAEEPAKEFEERSAGHCPTSPLSDYAVSRDAMYEGRDHRCVSSLTQISCSAVLSRLTLFALSNPRSFEADLDGGIPRFLPLLSPDEGLKPASEHGKVVACDLGPLVGKREG